jgi:hypothetical protein
MQPTETFTLRATALDGAVCGLVIGLILILPR